MFAWLNTQGAAFKNPLPGSTNYLSAYNKEGQLTRVVIAAKEKAREKARKGRQSDDSTQQRSQDQSGNSEATANGEAKAADLPPETTRDLAPFPLNRQFISQSILTSRFREHIWKLVIEEGQSVREVSATVGVEMSRVAAVVRLLEIEKEWNRIVSIISFLSGHCFPRLYDDIIKID